MICINDFKKNSNVFEIREFLSSIRRIIRENISFFVKFFEK